MITGSFVMPEAEREPCITPNPVNNQEVNLNVPETPQQDGQSRASIIDGLGQDLHHRASAIYRHGWDSLDCEAKRHTAATTVTSLTALFISAFGTTTILPPGEPQSAAGSILLGTAAEAALQFAGLFRATKEPLTIDNGYTIQCIRWSNKHPDRPLAPGAWRGVAAIIHPRVYDDGSKKPPGFAPSRLTDALEVIIAAADRPGSPISEVIIPGALTEQVGLGKGGEPFTQVISDITRTTIASPYPDTETATVIPIRDAKQLVASIRAPLLGKVMAELATRFPPDSTLLRSDNEGIEKALTTLLKKAAAAEAGRIMTTTMVTTLSKNAIRYTRREGRRRIRRKRRVPQTYPMRQVADTYAIVAKPARGNLPTVQTYNAETGDLVSIISPKDVIGVDTALFEDKFNSGRCSNTELVLAAIGLTNRYKATQQESRPYAQAFSGKEPSQAAQIEVRLPTGAEMGKPPNTIHAKREAYRIKRWAASIARLGLISLVIAGTNIAVEAVRDANDHLPIQEGIYKAENHGVPSRQLSAYWPQNVYYEHVNGGWVPNDHRYSHESIVPQALPDQNTPHITVQTMSSKPIISLPINDGTKIAAMDAIDADGKRLDVRLVYDPEGVYTARVTNNDKYYTLTYQLVRGGGAVHAIQPLKIEDFKEGTIGVPVQVGKDARTAAAYTAQSLTYDAAAWLEHARATMSPNDIIADVYRTKRCECEQCNATVAFVQALVNPTQHFAYTTGFRFNDLTEGSTRYFGTVGHAAGADSKGVVDATPWKTDKQSVVPISDNIEVERAWGTASKKFEARHSEAPLVLKLLGGIVLAGASILEVTRKGKDIRQVHDALMRYAHKQQWKLLNTNGIPLNSYVALMYWHWRIDKDTKMPELATNKEHPWVDPDSIPPSVLEDMANGWFRGYDQIDAASRKTLQKVAKAYLRDRRLAANPAP